MSTGPAHYAKAEEHLAKADAIETDGHEDGLSAWHQRQAIAHSLLALAAATALNDAEEGMAGHDYIAWHDVAATPCPDHDHAEVTA